MLHPVFQLIPECPIFLIDVEVILLVGIVGHKYIGIAIVVDIRDRHPQTETDQGPVNTGLPGNFGEMPWSFRNRWSPPPLRNSATPIHFRKVTVVGVAQLIDGMGLLLIMKQSRSPSRS